MKNSEAGREACMIIKVALLSALEGSWALIRSGGLENLIEVATRDPQSEVLAVTGVISHAY